MTEIDTDNDTVTLVNVFTVDEADQETLVDRLVEATEGTMREMPGYVSANIHRSLDGERVVNYAQWESKEAFEAMLDDEAASEHMQEIAALTEFDATLYEVVYTDDSAE